MLKKAWNSPTLMTWLSYSTKALTLFGVLPLVLQQFTPGDIVLWYLFSTIISLQSVADFGFRQTFSRIISYTYGGASDIGIIGNGDVPKASGQPNKPLLKEIISTMRFIYIWLTLVLFLLMTTLGTWSMIKPIENASKSKEACISWITLLIVSCASFYGKIFLNFLEGLNKIALVRRIEALTSIGSIISSILVLYFAPSLMNLVFINQFWVVIVIIRDWYLCRTTAEGFFSEVTPAMRFNKVIFQKIWHPAWRTGLSGFMSVGLTNLTGLIYAQIGNVAEVASYLLAIRIINQIKEVSMAPFYSKLPLLARLRVTNDQKGILRIIERGMLMSHLVFVAGFIIIGVFSNDLLRLINSDIQFLNNKMWLLLGVAFFVHRFGAMHIQVYSSTNHIISHIADGISGAIFMVSTLVAIQFMGIYAIPVGMIIGYLGFYSWYAAKYSYKSIGLNFWSFEKKVSVLPALVLLIYVIYSLS